MPRKKDLPYMTEGDIFATRLREVMAERGENQTTLAAKISAESGKIQRQSISQYMNGQSKPDTERLTALCKALNVSSDYLLGISDVKAYNMGFRVACELTGLSDEAAKIVMAISAGSKKEHLGSLGAAMNAFLSREKFISFILELKTLIVDSRAVAGALAHLSSYSEDEFPSDPLELLEYAKKKWGYQWESGERYDGFGAGFDVVREERKRGYDIYSCWNILMDIVKEISEEEIKKIGQLGSDHRGEHQKD